MKPKEYIEKYGIQGVWLVLNDEDNTTPIPEWYKNE